MYQSRYFKPTEYMCPCCGRDDMRPFFLEKLDLLRGLCGFPLMLSSGVRCRAHNRFVGGGEYSGHVERLAADIRCSHDPAHTVLKNATLIGFPGIGIKQHGAVEKRFIHLDWCESLSQRPRPTIWTYSP